jgi:hypothetical protein
MIFSICKSLLLFLKIVSYLRHPYLRLTSPNFRSDESFFEPPPKRAKSCTVLPNPAASEASAPAAAPAAQISTASSLSKGKDIPSTAAVAAPSPMKPVSLFLF